MMKFDFVMPITVDICSLDCQWTVSPILGLPAMSQDLLLYVEFDSYKGIAEITSHPTPESVLIHVGLIFELLSLTKWSHPTIHLAAVIKH